MIGQPGGSLATRTARPRPRPRPLLLETWPRPADWSLPARHERLQVHRAGPPLPARARAPARVRGAAALRLRGRRQRVPWPCLRRSRLDALADELPVRGALARGGWAWQDQNERPWSRQPASRPACSSGGDVYVGGAGSRGRGGAGQWPVRVRLRPSRRLCCAARKTSRELVVLYRWPALFECDCW